MSTLVRYVVVMLSRLRVKYPHLNQLALYFGKCLLLLVAAVMLFSIGRHLVTNSVEGPSNQDPQLAPLVGLKWSKLRQQRFEDYQLKQTSMKGRGEQGQSVALSKVIPGQSLTI